MEDLDHSEFHDVFFEEVDEHLRSMEASLLDLRVDAVDAEVLDAIFRAAHSIKGGAAVFGFEEIAALTHDLEAVLDRVRTGLLSPDGELVDALLASGDLLRAMFTALRDDATLAPGLEASGAARLRAYLPASGPSATAAQPNDAARGHDTAAAPPPSHAKPASAELASRLPHGADSTSIRVGVQKVDDLINLIGELVIAQSMLSASAGVGTDDRDAPANAELPQRLAQLGRITRDVQDAAMAIRMLPMSVVFGRFPRLVHDLAEHLGKRVDLRIEGEATEVDKGLIESIVDPLTHLMRNALDHGIESPAERLAAGKPEHGTITLRAFHRGGSIMVEVLDDGAGMDRERILAKARERGMKAPEDLGDREVFKLIFEPGFSTVEQVTDLSGRGVGMDVVRRNIRALGGDVTVDSTFGTGTCISFRLPLTLAIIDGMSVAVGAEVFVVPLTYIVESLHVRAGDVKTIGQSQRLIHLRGDYVPLFSLREAFGLPGAVDAVEDGVVIVVESDRQRIALLVDALVGQHQVVIKSIESNYRRVRGVAGATIMGDGRVALILDVPHFVGAGALRLEAAA